MRTFISLSARGQSRLTSCEATPRTGKYLNEMKELKSDILSALSWAAVCIACTFFAGYGNGWLRAILWIPFAAFYFFSYKVYKKLQEKRHEEENPENEPKRAVAAPGESDARGNSDPDTKTIALAALNRLGCSMETTEEKHLVYSFQGFYFVMSFDDSFFARIALLPTPVCRKTDVVTFMELQDVLNLLNIHYGHSYYWVDMNASDGEEENVGFVIKDFLMLHPALPHVEVYIAKEMEHMIRERYDILDCMERRRADKENGTKESAASSNAEEQ